MSRLQTLLIYLLICVPGLVMTVLGVLHVRREVVKALDSSGWVVADEISRQIGREVHIGKAVLTPLGTLVVEDVRIAQGPSFSEGILASARRLSASYDYKAMLFQGAGSSGIHSIEVVEPHLRLVRGKDGILNISDLLEPAPGPPGPPFTGTVSVVGGTVSFRDYYRSSSGSPLVTVVREVDGSFDASRPSAYSFNFSVGSSPGRFTAIRGTGTYDLDTADLWVDATGSGISASFAAITFGVQNDIGAGNGTVDFSASGTFRIGDESVAPRVAGMVKLDGVTVKPPGFRSAVERVSGTAMVGGETAVLNLNGSIAGSPAIVKGSISGIRQPRLNLAVSARDVRVRELFESVGLPVVPSELEIDRIPALTARVTGPMEDPRVEAFASVPKAVAFGYPVSDVTLSLAYSGGVIGVRSAQLTYDGARVYASGTVGLSEGVPLNVRGSVRGLDLGRLPISVDNGLVGKSDADFVLTGSVADPRVTAEVAAKNLSIDGVYIGQAEAGLVVSRQGVVAKRLQTTGFAGGIVRGTGGFDGKQLDVRVSASGIQLSSVGRLLGRNDLGGLAYASGTITGPLDAPVFEGLLEGFGLRYQDQELNYARADVIAGRDSVDVKSAVARWFPADLKFSGRVERDSHGRLAFRTSGQVDRLNLERVFQAVGVHYDVSGMVGGDFAASGVYDMAAGSGASPLSGTEASGNLRLRDGTVFDYAVDDAVAQWTFRDNIVALSETVIESDGARLVVEGNVDVDRRDLNLSFGLSDLELTRYRESIPDFLLVSGVVNAAGTATGPWNDVLIELGGGVGQLSVNRMSFDEADVHAVYAGGIVKSAQVNLARGDQQYQLSLSDYDTTAQRVRSGVVDVVDASVSDLWEAVKASPIARTEQGKTLRELSMLVPKVTGGTLDVHASVTGDLARLEGDVTANASGIGIDSQKVDSLEIAASVGEGEIVLRNLRATSGDTNVQARGNPLLADGNLQLALSVNNLDLQTLKPWMGANTPAGNASIELEASGRATSPDLILSAEVVNPGVFGVVFDRLRASRIDISEGRISFDDPNAGVILASANHQAVIYGFVPWSWSEHTIPAQEPLEVTAELNNEDLSILSSFISEVDAQKTTGPIETAVFRIRGSLVEAQYDGLLRIKDGNLALKGFSSEFQEVNVDVAFDGNRVLVNEFSTKSSLGGTAAIAPGSNLAISGKDAGVRMLVLADGFHVAESGVFGLKEVFSTKIDAGLTVTGSLASPMIVDAQEQVLNAGLKGLTVPEGLKVHKGIRISDALFRFAIPEESRAAQPINLPMNPQFDISFEVGRDVKLQPPSMNLLVDGSGAITGAFNDPAKPLDILLNLTVDKGSLYLAGTRLTVDSGSSAVVRYSPPAEPTITLKDFKATTSLTATSELGRRERYQIYLTVAGPTSNMQIDLSSNPPGLSRQRILAALGHMEGIFSTGESAFQEELTTALTATATSRLFRPIEKVFTEQFGFDQFSLEYSRESPLSLYLSTELLNNVNVSYFQRLRSKISEQNTKQFELKASWRFHRAWELSLGVDDQEVIDAQIGYTKAFR